MKTLPANLVIEKNRIATTHPWLVLLDITLPDGTMLYLVRNNEDITFGGRVYTAIPFEIEPTKMTSKGEIPTVSLKISNVTRVIQSYLETYNGAVGSKVLVRVIRYHSESDEFNESVNYLTGGDGSKIRNWSLRNSSKLSVLDANLSAGGVLTMTMSNPQTGNFVNNTFTGGWLSKPSVISGDFDVEVHLSSYNHDYDGEKFLLGARSTDNDWLGILFGQFSGLTRIYLRDTVGGTSTDYGTYTNPHPVLRMRREGSTFRFFTKANPTDAWVERASRTRADLPDTLEIGLGLSANYTSSNYSVGVSYFSCNTIPDDFVELEMSFEVLSTVSTGLWATFTLGAMSLLRRRFPLYRYLAHYCNWFFKSVECGYTGAGGPCKRTLDSCRELGNSSRFGGQPGLANSTGVRLV